jgi:CRP/FNR family transcriptional regulator
MAIGKHAARALADAGAIQRLRPGQALPRRSAPNASFYIVREGVLAAAIDLPGKRRSLVAFYYPGQLIAGMSSHDIASDVLAITHAEVRRVEQHTLERLVAADTAAALAVIAAIDRHAESIKAHCAMLVRLTGEERVASFLVEAAMHLGRRVGKHIEMQLPIRRGEIADYLGLNADTVSRIFSRLRKARIIEFNGRSAMCIVDWPRLRELSPLPPRWSQGPMGP